MKKIDKTKTASIALILMLTFSATILALPMVSAHDPPWNVPTYAYIYASPNPIGVGQTAVLIFWLDKIPPTAAGVGGDRWSNMTVEVTKPDETKQRLGPFTSDPVGGGWTTYTPDQVGTYTFVFSFPGQVASLYNPVTGVPGNAGSPYINDTYAASSATATLTVQQDPIPDPPSYPLPTDYWTRPINSENREWSSISGNWLCPHYVWTVGCCAIRLDLSDNVASSQPV